MIIKWTMCLTFGGGFRFEEGGGNMLEVRFLCTMLACTIEVGLCIEIEGQARRAGGCWSMDEGWNPWCCEELC